MSSRPPPTDTHPFDTPHNGVAATASRLFVSMRRPFSPPASPRRKDSENLVGRAIAPVPVPVPVPVPLTSLSVQRAAMYSTPEERHTHDTSRAARSRHYLDARPTIEQIAMGLHVSRTPHLRPAPNPLLRYPPSPPPPRRSLPSTTLPPRASSDNIRDSSSASSQHRTRHSLPPPPSRSSMKKTSPSLSTLTQSQPQWSSSTVSPSAEGASQTQASPRPLSSLRIRMSKFIQGYRPPSFTSSLGRASSFTSSASDSTRPTTPRKAVRFSTSALAVADQRLS